MTSIIINPFIIDTSGGGGGTTPTVSITNRTVTGSGDKSEIIDAEAWYTLKSNGVLEVAYTDGLGGVTITNISGEWLNDSVTGSDYEVYFTVTSGSLSSGSDSTGAWLNLGTDRVLYKVKSSITTGTQSVIVSVQIRDASTLSVLDTASITLTCSVVA